MAYRSTKMGGIIITTMREGGREGGREWRGREWREKGGGGGEGHQMPLSVDFPQVPLVYY